VIWLRVRLKPDLRERLPWSNHHSDRSPGFRPVPVRTLGGDRGVGRGILDRSKSGARVVPAPPLGP